MTYPKNTQARIIIGNIVMGRLRKQAYFIKVILLSNGQDGLCMGGVHKGCLGWLHVLYYEKIVFFMLK
jgi:hypothetical protein